MVERRFKKVCAGIGGNFVGQGRAYFQTKVRLDPISSFQDGEWKRKTIYPRLRNVRGNWEGFSGEIAFFHGQSIDDYKKNAERFAVSFSVPFVTFDIAPNGLFAIRAGKVPVPAAYDHPGAVQASQARNNQPLLQQSLQSQQTLQAQLKQPVAKNTLPIEEVPPGVLQAANDVAKKWGWSGVAPVYAHRQQDLGNVWAYELELLKGVPVASDTWETSGKLKYRIPIESNHWFIAARTGGGKGSWIWSLVLGLVPAWKVGLVKFWGIDPKMNELGIERGWWEHYADDDQSSVELLERAVDEMHARGRHMQGVSRKFSPSVQTPLNVVVIDEMGYLLASMSDKKLKERANTAVAALLNKGRSPGFAVVGCVQDPRKETCNQRDGFTIRIAGGMPAPMVDLVLGDGMYEAGAYCCQIPLGNAGAGVAYVISQTTFKPVCVRAPWVSDEAIWQAYQNAVRRMAGADQLKTDDLSGQLD